jgi:hypothetical protein
MTTSFLVLMNSASCANRLESVPATVPSKLAINDQGQDRLNIDQALDLWIAGHRDEAVTYVLKMENARSSSDRWRPRDARAAMTPRIATSEPNTMLKGEYERLRKFRQLIQEIDARAGVALAHGDLDQAERLITCIVRVATENRSPNVTDRMDRLSVGFNKLAQKRRIEVNAQREPSDPAPEAGMYINQVIDLWRASRHEEAIQTALELQRSKASIERWRVCDSSEETFVADPRDELETRKAELLERINILRDCVREMDRRICEQIVSGELDNAELSIEFIHHLGKANLNPHVPLIVDLVGQHFIKISEKRQLELDEKTQAQGSKP